MDSNITLCASRQFREIDHFQCTVVRVTGTTILILSIAAMVFNCRFLLWSYRHRHILFRHHSFVLSMVASSILVIFVILPSIFMQCLFCHRLCSPFYCQLEGFISYLNGCVHMFMLMMISVIRYTTVFENSMKNKLIDHNSYLMIVICWLLGLIFAVPPLFNWNRYTPEGIGFHCGLDWFDRSFHSLIYFILAFSLIYFIPLVVLSVINLYVYCRIRRLLRTAQYMTEPCHVLNVSYQKSQLSLRFSSSNNSSKSKCARQNGIVVTNPMKSNSSLIIFRKKLSLQTENHHNELNRLKADRRFAVATIFLVCEYILSWTPYALLALFHLWNIKFLDQESVMMTVCAFIAKTSMILNPVIYLITIKVDYFKVVVFCCKCSCSSCRVK